MQTSKQPIVIETSDVVRVNDLYNSTEWRAPKYDEHRHVYIMIRKVKK